MSKPNMQNINPTSAEAQAIKKAFMPAPPIPSSAVPQKEYLYHGTTLANWRKARLEGLLKPRGSSSGNWGSTVRSGKDRVYLTTVYGLHFAWCAGEGEDLVVLELDPVEMSAHHMGFCADEDALEQIDRQDPKSPRRDWDMKRRTIYWRARAHSYGHKMSLQSLGTCAVMGSIPTSLVRRACIIDNETAVLLRTKFADPSISLMNFKLMGESYKSFTSWLFQDQDYFLHLGVKFIEGVQCPVTVQTYSK